MTQDNLTDRGRTDLAVTRFAVTQFAVTQFAKTQFAVTQFDGTANAGRKGIAYDWQSLLAADGLTAIEAGLAGLVMESAE